MPEQEIAQPISNVSLSRGPSSCTDPLQKGLEMSVADLVQCSEYLGPAHEFQALTSYRNFLVAALLAFSKCNSIRSIMGVST